MKKNSHTDNVPRFRFSANMGGQTGLVMAILIPFVALGLQWLLWDYLAPFVWFLFFPAVFFSARLGRFKGGLISTVISTLIVVYVFLPPQLSWQIKNLYSLFSVGMFLVMGYLFSDIQERFWQANLLVEQALQESRVANEKITQLYEKTRELDEIKTQFFANVSHELRTPLTLILGPVRKMLQVAGLNSETRRDLEIVERNARFLHRHVDDLLDVSKLDAGHMTIHYSQVDLAQVTRMVASQFDLIADEYHIRYGVSAPDSISAQVDVEKYQRILLNLLSNAFKFTPDGGLVDISLAVESSSVVIEVRDSGPGIPSDKREAIFERFRQLEGNASRKHGGTGLGLSIVKEFVELHHGKVKVDNTSIGGALFVIYLPLAAPAGVEVQPAPVEINRETGSQLLDELLMERAKLHAVDSLSNPNLPLILVVEDNPDMNRFICDALSKYYRVAAAADGRAGLEKAIALEPDLILTDVMMPVMSGDEMARAIRERAELKDVPIVILTAKASDLLRVQLLQESVQDYINKPFAVEELLARVENLLSARRRAAEKLQATASQLKVLIQVAPLAITMLDVDGRVRLWNASAERIFGWTAAEILGEPNPIVPVDRRQEYIAWSDQVLRGDPIVNQETTRRRKDGILIDVSISSAPLYDFTGRIIGRMAILADITARKRAEAEILHLNANLEQRIEERTHELREAQERLVQQEKAAVLGQIAGSMGHELRNPLGVISNAVYFLKMTQPDASKQVKEYLDLIEEHIHISNNIVTDLLDFARVKLAERVSLSLVDILRLTLDHFPAPENVNVKMDLPADLPQVCADQQHLLQILGNLLLNAYQAMPHGGDLTISAAVHGDLVAVIVQDTGSGITADDLKKIFEPLFTTRPKGVGLGLAVSKKLIEANSGTIEAESEVGVGSTFSIYLPLQQGQHKSAGVAS